MKKLIDKPKGQAGRSELKGEYSLQQAMGLAGDNRKYNTFRMIAQRYMNRYLNTEKTLKEQPKLMVTLLLSYAQRKHQFLAKFRDNWPFHDFIASYLCNHVQYTKKQHANLDDSEVSIPAHAKPALAPLMKPTPHAPSAPCAQLTPCTKPAPKSKMTQVPACHLDLLIPTSNSLPAAKPKPKPKPRPISSLGTHTTKVVMETPPTTGAKPKATPVSIPHDTRAKTKFKPAEASAAHLKTDTTVNNDDDAYKFADLPLVCPNDSCKDLVPADPTIELVKQLQQ
ncbi:uncharacterized protein EDB91DRAFT_1243113 [Suillus paluster]|uniref:uncharacterized protein n=1 Tax=Suillus paluster TaxID=48578 RepID=UPI001B85EF39|nr:uncharacterized protein EDB91DRAFT_1243113 [Suillus paluster]KAG1752335.1 hypothetical protein EDB91DRAFT_1243113 [Suillus paluster]